MPARESAHGVDQLLRVVARERVVELAADLVRLARDRARIRGVVRVGLALRIGLAGAEPERADDDDGDDGQCCRQEPLDMDSRLWPAWCLRPACASSFGTRLLGLCGITVVEVEFFEEGQRPAPAERSWSGPFAERRGAAGARRTARSYSADPTMHPRTNPLSERPSSPPALFPAGLVCGVLRISGVLGIGGTGTVFEAVDERDGTAVAVKAIPHDAVLRQRAVREAAVAGRLDHPHVVRLRDVLEDDEYVYVVSELIDGGDLATALRSNRLSDASLLRIAAAICDALDCAHAAGIIHRDVKPANVLLGRDGSVRLADFGIAALAEPDATIDERLLGTLSYMAPEACAGARPAPPADVWAVGVLLYEALSGANPFRARRPGELRELHAEGARPLGEVRPDLPRPVQRACMRSLSASPRRRPSAAALREVLLAGADALESGRDDSNVVPLRRPGAPPRTRTRPTLPTPRLPALRLPAWRPPPLRTDGAGALAGSALEAIAVGGVSETVAVRAAGLARRVGPAVCAALTCATVFDAFPFWPPGLAAAIAVAAGLVALVVPWAGAAVVLASVLPAIGDVSAGLAWTIAAGGAAWLLLCAGAGRRALLPALAVPLAAAFAWPVYLLFAGSLRTAPGRALAGAAGAGAVALWGAWPAAAGVAGMGDAVAVAGLAGDGVGAPLVAQAAAWGLAAALWPLAWRAQRRALAISAWLGMLLVGQAIVPAAAGVAPEPLTSSVVAVWALAILLVLGVPARTARD